MSINKNQQLRYKIPLAEESCEGMTQVRKSNKKVRRGKVKENIWEGSQLTASLIPEIRSLFMMEGWQHQNPPQVAMEMPLVILDSFYHGWLLYILNEQEQTIRWWFEQWDRHSPVFTAGIRATVFYSKKLWKPRRIWYLIYQVHLTKFKLGLCIDLYCSSRDQIIKFKLNFLNKRVWCISFSPKRSYTEAKQHNLDLKINIKIPNLQ